MSELRFLKRVQLRGCLKRTLFHMQPLIISTKALIIDPRGMVLVLHEYEKDRWEFVGGRIDDEEHPEACLAREIKEEIGAVMETARAHVFHADRFLTGKGVPALRLFFILPDGEINPTLTKEHDRFAWVDPRHPLPEGMEKDVGGVFARYCDHEGIVAAAKVPPSHEGFGLIQVFTGNGKGKTTAALGEAIRALGAGKSVGIVYFDKGGEHYSERHFLDFHDERPRSGQETFHPLSLRGASETSDEAILPVAYIATGRDRMDLSTGRFDFSITNKDRTEAERGLEAARKFFKEGRDLIILDEINSAVNLGMMKEEDVLRLLDEKPEKIEVVLTGRNAPISFLTCAHLVTDMRLRKHYFYSGVKAREGLDY